MSAFDKQVGGDYYRSFAISPFEFVERNNLSFGVGNVIKYICRWREKNGIEDLKKARHYIDLLIELEERGFIDRQENRFEDIETIEVGDITITEANSESDWTDRLA